MKEKIEKFLPIGTIVRLKGSIGYLMITGYLVKKVDNNGDYKQIFDYSGILYPIGFTSPNENVMFNQDVIEDVLFKGFENDMFKRYIEKLKDSYEEQKEIDLMYIINGNKETNIDNTNIENSVFDVNNND